MASILISFVGKQDPVSDTTKDDGSIVTLVHHLLALEQTISQVILLYTQDTQERAELTKGWLEDYPLNLAAEQVYILPVDSRLSTDPVNLLLATQEARKGIERAKGYLNPSDRLEFNASSGTPVMKYAWSILQAAGYAPNSAVWQVRNPHQMKPGQQRVFSTDVEGLKQEFDLKVIQQQLQDYNYSGALASLATSSLGTDFLSALLGYGQARLAFNFDQAFAQTQPFQGVIPEQFSQEIAALRQKQPEALLKEIYFKALIKLKQQEYSDFLILIFAFQENLMHYLMKRKFLAKPRWRKGWKSVEGEIWEQVKQFEGGKLHQYLQNYRLRNGNLLRLGDEFNRVVMIAILEYDGEFSRLLEPIQVMDSYASQRNSYVHHLEGVSKIPEQEVLMSNMQTVLKLITQLPQTHPLDALNDVINLHLSNQISSLA